MNSRRIVKNFPCPSEMCTYSMAAYCIISPKKPGAILVTFIDAGFLNRDSYGPRQPKNAPPDPAP
jgi:hypothetical protein